MLSHYVSSHQKDWDAFLPFLAWAMNTSKSETTGFMPFELVYGREPVQPINVIGYDGHEKIQDLAKYLWYIRNWVVNAKEVALEKVNKSHDKEAPRYNAKRSLLEFDKGDLVLEWSPAKKARVGR